MLEIVECAINLCSRSEAEIDNLCERALILSGIAPSRIYIGSELCDRLLDETFFRQLPGLCTAIAQHGMSVTLVIPLLRENNGRQLFARLLELCKSLSEYIDELVFNDFGSMLMLAEAKASDSFRLVAGRLFDRSVRECRFDIFSFPEITANRQLVSSPTLTNGEYKRIFLEHGVSTFETDTLPDGVLILPEDSVVNVHYPRIYLSSAGVCEYASVGIPAVGKFRPSEPCSKQCQSIKTCYSAGRHRIYKHGRGIFALQDRSLAETVDGRIRLVFSTIVQGSK